MCTEATARRTLEEMDLVEGLSGPEVRLRLQRLTRLTRLGDLGQRGLAFYLLEMDERGLHQQQGNERTVFWAQAKLGLDPRRVRELLRAGRKLLELPAVDRAFCEQEISWTKVLTLLRVARPGNEEIWVEKARKLSCKDLKRAVLVARADGSPREAGDPKGTHEITYRERLILGVLAHKKLEQAQAKLSAELGRAATTSELVDVALGLYLDMENDGSSPGWTHVSSSLYRIVLRPWSEPGSDAQDLPLLVETEDGMLPIDGGPTDDVIAQTRTACACCDGEMVPDCDADDPHAHDVPTPPAMRRRVLKRDGHRCRCCGGRGDLHVHHIVFRASGGRTKVWNLITLCVRCHALVHAGLLVIEGARQRKARFVDGEGRPVHEPGRTIEPSALLRIVTPEPRSLGDLAGAPALSAETALEEVPAVVDGAWWDRHADRIRDRGARGLELRPGRLAIESSEPVEEVAPERVSFEEAFAGIVGQDGLLERLRKEAVGGDRMGEAFPHTLFMGPPGTGKTTLATGIAASLGSRLVATTGPTLQDVHGLVCLLASLRESDVLFLDEIHAVPRRVLEALYEAMAEGRLSLRLRAGPRTRTVKLQLPTFTLLAATTEPGELPRPLKTRFALQEHLGFYEGSDLARLATARAKAKGFELEAEAALRLANYSRGTPREVLRLLDRVLRFAAAEGRQGVHDAHALEALLAMGYDRSGLTREDRRILRELRGSREPIPLLRLARRVGMDPTTLREEIEPWLCRLGLVRITPRGRTASPHLLGEARAPAAEGAY